MDNGLEAAGALADAAADASFEAQPHPSAAPAISCGGNKVEVAYVTSDEARRLISANVAELARRSSPAFASAPPPAPLIEASEDTAALVAAVRDYVRPSLRDSSFPLAEAFARETRRREAAAADARHSDVVVRAAMRAELTECRTGWGELRAAVLPLIRPELAEAAKGWTLPALLAEEMRLRGEEMRLRGEEARALSAKLVETQDALVQAQADARLAQADARLAQARTVDAIGKQLVAILDGAIRDDVRERHAGDLCAALAEEFALRDKERADLLEEMRLRAAERDSLARELSEARDSLDALDQANQGLRKERDAAVAERVEQEAVEMLGESLVGEDFVEVLDAGIRAELLDRHPDDLSARLAEEFALRDKERADLLEELRGAKAISENAKAIVASAVESRDAARAEAARLRLEKDALAADLAAARQAHEVDRAYVAQQQGRIEKLERAIVAQATLLSDLDDQFRGVLANRFTTRAIRVASR